ncbi:MAG: helix-turn-helix domain-containing protein [Saccharofermentanaceae bacterium]|jgi:chromosomal replication initiator protein
MIEKITKIICEGEYVSEKVVFNKTREIKIIYARQLIQYFCYEFQTGTYKYIGEQTGGKNHATVIHSRKVIKNYIDTDKVKAEKINLYRKKIKENLIITHEQGLEVINKLIDRLEKEMNLAKKKLSEYQNIYQN